MTNEFPPIPDDRLADFDRQATDDRWSLNAYWYKRLRERLRLAERWLQSDSAYAWTNYLDDLDAAQESKP